MEDNASLGDSAQLPPPSPELLSSRAARSRLSRAGTAPQAERSSYAAMLSDLERIVTRFPSLPRGSTAVPPPPAQPQLQPQHLQHPQTPQPQQQEEEDEHMMQMMMMAFDDDASAAAAGGYARSSFQSNYVGAVGGSGDGGSSSKIRPLSVEPTRLGRDERSPRGGFGAITLDAAVRGSPAGNPRGGASPGDQSTDRATVRAAPTGCATDSATACAATCATAECFRGSDGMERMQLMASFMAAQAEDEEEGKGEEDEEGEGDEGEGEGEEGEGEKKGNERMKVDDGENEGGERVTGAESARARVVTAANAPTADGNAALVEGGEGAPGDRGAMETGDGGGAGHGHTYGAGTDGRLRQRQANIKPRSMRERRRRERISESLRRLRLAVPLDILGPHQDLGSMIEGAVNYIQVMQMRLAEMQQRVLEGEIRARLNM